MSQAPTRKAASAATAEIAGVRLSNPDKPYFPEIGLSKHDVAAYYAAVAPVMLPYVSGRPLSLVRCPDGWQGECFYQKHAPPSLPATVGRIAVPEGTGNVPYAEASSATALVALVQWGVIEMHPWGARKPRIDRPDQLIFDFDPDGAVSWEVLVEAVTALRTLLTELGLVPFIKTTGGKGLHVVTPLRATITWDVAKGFAKAVAELMAATYPDRYVTTVSKARRKGRIFIDYLRNAMGSTAVAPYGLRARKGAPVAMPIAWSDLAQDVRLDHFNATNAARHVARRRTDPWAEFAASRRTLTAAMRRRAGAA
ncbi:MAG: non-homologous end-joining DNA ligase [Proteobacteria bacterium]|nr:non-homologous end-joining DNA ligase [Pseudomonadota bacterium]